MPRAAVAYSQGLEKMGPAEIPGGSRGKSMKVQRLRRRAVSSTPPPPQSSAKRSLA